MTTEVIGPLIGIASTALGLFVLWASPISTVSCSRDSAGVACRVDRAMLGILPLEGVKVAGVQGATVDRSSPPRDPSQTADEAQRVNDTYQLAFQTKSGRVAPRGVDDSSGEGLQEIAHEVDELVGGQGQPFAARSFNAFPNVAGTIFLVMGVLMMLFAR